MNKIPSRPAVPVSSSEIPRVTRRTFLGTSAVLCAFPASLWAQNENASEAAKNSIRLRFAVMSDVHFSENPNSSERQRLIKALAFLETYASDAPHPGFDALVVAGDMSNHGSETELTLFRDTLFSGIPKGTKPVLCMGNHEFYGGNRDRWERIFKRNANTHEILNGFHFLGISPERGTCGNGDYRYALEWLRKELESAVKEDPKRPVFVFQHYHLSETVYGSCGEDHWGISDLRPVLDDFPQVLDFSGHSHYPINDPRSVWQERFTAFGTGTLSYFEMAGGIFEKFPEGHQQAAQFYVVEVLNDNSVHLKLYDIISEFFFDTEYLVAEPGCAAKYLYTNARYETSEAPFWGENEKTGENGNENGKGNAEGKEENTPELKIVGEITPYGATLEFPQAHDAQCVGSYQIRMERKRRNPEENSDEKTSRSSDSGWEFFGEQNPWSQYYFREQPAVMSVPLYTLEPENMWRVSVRARNVFGKMSEKTLFAEFETPKDPYGAPDCNAAKPEADVISVHFEEGKALNTPSSERFPRELEVVGTPVFAEGVARFSGKGDFCRIPFGAKDYAMLTSRITMSARFEFNAFRDGGVEDIFSNTEGGGSCVELNHSRKELEFWCHTSGRYTIVRTPITPGTHTVFGVFDGKNVILYLDGSEAARASAHGPLTYTSNASARAFCVGSDVASGNTGSAFFCGNIHFARVYSWALTPEQVKNLTE